MARTNNLTNFLTDVASAIKTKKGDNTAIQASAFDTEILALPSQGTYQHKTITISQNGDTTVSPDQNYDAMDQVTVQVRVPVAQLQTKTMSITSNMNIEIEPDSGYDGFSKLGLNVSVPSKDVKLFATEQTMQADNNKTLDELAVVYASSISNIQSDSVFSSCLFPSTVVLPAAVSSDSYADFGPNGGSVWFQGYAEIGRTYFRFEGYGDTAYVRVQYSSSDGITYTRTDSGEEIIDFGVSIQWRDYGNPWDDNIGYFMKISSQNFSGLFKCTEDPNYYYKTFTYNDITIDTTNNTILVEANNNNLVERATIEKALQKLRTVFMSSTGNVELGVMTNANRTKLYLTALAQYDSSTGKYSFMSNWAGYYLYNNKLICALLNNANYNPYQFEYDIANDSIIEDSNMTLFSEGAYKGTDITAYICLGAFRISYKNVFEPISQWGFSYQTTLGSTLFSTQYSGCFPSGKLVYTIAPTQFTLKATNELLPGKIGLGKNGVVTGDGSIYDGILSPTQYSEVQSKNNYIYRHRNKSQMGSTFQNITGVDDVILDGDYAYVFSGTKGVRFNMWTNEWVNLANPPHNVRTAVKVGDDIYFFSSSDNSYKNKVTKYSITNNSYTTLSGNTPRQFITGSGQYYNGNVYLFGGYTETAANTLYRYNVQGNSFTRLSDIPKEHFGYMTRTQIVNDIVYVLGCGGTPSTTAFKYDITNASYTELHQMPITVYSGVTGLINNEVYIAGNGVAYKYDDTEDLWETMTSGLSIGGNGFIRPDGIIFSTNANTSWRESDIFNILDLPVEQQVQLIYNHVNTNVISSNIKNNTFILGVRGSYTGEEAEE